MPVTYPVTIDLTMTPARETIDLTSPQTPEVTIVPETEVYTEIDMEPLSPYIGSPPVTRVRGPVAARLLNSPRYRAGRTLPPVTLTWREFGLRRTLFPALAPEPEDEMIPETPRHLWPRAASSWAVTEPDPWEMVDFDENTRPIPPPELGEPVQCFDCMRIFIYRGLDSDRCPICSVRHTFNN